MSMGNGNIESYYQVIHPETVRKVVGEELFDGFMQKLDAFRETGVDDYDINDALQDDYVSFDSERPDWTALEAAYHEVHGEFFRTTGIHLTYLYLNGDGDCYDDLESDKWYWVLDEEDVWVREKTPKMQALEHLYGEDAFDLDSRFSTFG